MKGIVLCVVIMQTSAVKVTILYSILCIMIMTDWDYVYFENINQIIYLTKSLNMKYHYDSSEEKLQHCTRDHITIWRRMNSFPSRNKLQTLCVLFAQTCRHKTKMAIKRNDYH